MGRRGSDAPVDARHAGELLLRRQGDRGDARAAVGRPRCRHARHARRRDLARVRHRWQTRRDDPPGPLPPSRGPGDQAAADRRRRVRLADHGRRTGSNADVVADRHTSRLPHQHLRASHGRDHPQGHRRDARHRPTRRRRRDRRRPVDRCARRSPATLRRGDLGAQQPRSTRPPSTPPRSRATR